VRGEELVGEDGVRSIVGGTRESWNSRHRRRDNRKHEKRDVLHRVGRGGGTQIERSGFIKTHIPRNVHPATNGIPTPIDTMLITVSKKNTLNGLSGHLGAFTWC
jgi:hypothetical protein